MPKSRKRIRPKRRRREPGVNPLALDRMFDAVVNDTFRVDVPKVLYHYTTWAGAQGIITSQRFWATAHDCTNDEAELVSADEIIVQVARELRTKARGAVAKVLDLFLDGYPEQQVTKVMTHTSDRVSTAATETIPPRTRKMAGRSFQRVPLRLRSSFHLAAAWPCAWLAGWTFRPPQ